MLRRAKKGNYEQKPEIARRPPGSDVIRPSSPSSTAVTRFFRPRVGCLAIKRDPPPHEMRPGSRGGTSPDAARTADERLNIGT